MQSAVARRSLAVRKLAARRVPRAVPGPVVRSRVAPRAIRIAGATFTFSIAYAVLTVLHATGGEPRVLHALSPIPLFARVVACTLMALPGGFLADRVLPRRAVRAIPALLAAGAGLAFVAILVWA